MSDEGDSQAVGAAIGLLVDSEADIPAVEAYARALKSGGAGEAQATIPTEPEPAAVATSAQATPPGKGSL